MVLVGVVDYEANTFGRSLRSSKFNLLAIHLKVVEAVLSHFSLPI
jgi:hypothetical protein